MFGSISILFLIINFMKTAKETFDGRDTFDASEWRSSGAEEMVRREIADQVAGLLRNM
jgi:hypothetical protein